MSKIHRGLVLLLAVGLSFAQQSRGPVLSANPDGRIRIFVGDSETWESTSFSAAAASRTLANGFGGATAGTVKLTIRVMQEINDRCKPVVIVNKPDTADLFVRVDHNRGMWSVHEDMAVFNKAGEMVFASSSPKIQNDVKKFCKSPVFPQQPLKQKHK